MRVDQLDAAALDRLVAHLEGFELDDSGVPIRHNGVQIIYMHPHTDMVPYSPTSQWSEGGPIIDREGISLTAFAADTGEKLWVAARMAVHEQALVSAMRSYVALRYGLEVPDDVLQKVLNRPVKN